MTIAIDGHPIALGSPAYFIADIASARDGDLERAKHLIHLCKRDGRQRRQVPALPGRGHGLRLRFKNLGGQLSHQATWKKSGV